MTKTKVIRAAVVSLVSLTVGLGPALAQATYSYLYEYTYYSDASHAQAVGIKTEHCDQYATVSGEITEYYDRVRIGHITNSTGYCVEY
jgi:hypothetical protein